MTARSSFLRVSAPPVSRVRITNIGSDPLQRPISSSRPRGPTPECRGGETGDVVVPPNDVVTLTDRSLRFRFAAPARDRSVRAAPRKIDSRRFASSPHAGDDGGGYSYEMPTLLLGEGARLGSSHVIVGVASNSTTRTALTLAETSGTELTRVRAILFDAQGARKDDRLIDVPRYGQTRIDNVVTALGGSEPLDGGRIELSVESGGGAVAGVVTILDATRNNGAVLVSQPTAGTVSGSAYARLRRAKVGTAEVSVSAVAPVVVNGPSSAGPSQRTTMGFTVTTSLPLTAVVTYRPSDPAAPPISKTLQLLSRVGLHSTTCSRISSGSRRDRRLADRCSFRPGSARRSMRAWRAEWNDLDCQQRIADCFDDLRRALERLLEASAVPRWSRAIDRRNSWDTMVGQHQRDCRCQRFGSGSAV